MHTAMKTALLGVGLVGALFAGGCGGRYYHDDYYGSRYSDRGYYHHDRDDDDYYRDSHRQRVRVCDADGDDCHWEYRDR